jgi:uncharacterized protein YndB with AHSA1/START domain
MIRRRIADVFSAFVDPTITTRFWFTRSSGRLEKGKRVRWDWAMYGTSTELMVKALEPYSRILLEWDGPDHPTEVEWHFSEVGRHRTLVKVENRGFAGDRDAMVAAAIESTQGFALALGGAKVFLEHGIDPRFIVDHAPERLVTAGAARAS